MNYDNVKRTLSKKLLDATRYQHIKAVSNTELGIATQCVVLDGRRPPPNKQAKHVDKSVLGNIIAGSY